MLPIALSVAIALTTAPAPIPMAWLEGPQPPVLTAEAYILYDETSGTVLLEEDADSQRAMASVTKLMTALVASEVLAPDASTIISSRAADVGEAEIGLIAGERWSIHELMTAMLVRSGNDAAVAVAEAAAGSVSSFVALMNEKAAQLGMNGTRFANPHGLDDPDHYSTARDLIILARAAIADPLIERLARTRVARFLPDPQTGKERRAFNTNHLLGAYPGTVGLKTGFTSDAGKVLIGAAARGDRRIFTVVMDSEDHFLDTRQLFEYGFDSFGPADRLLGGFAGEEGGGPGPDAPLPSWLQIRLGAQLPLDDGSWSTSDLGDLRLESTRRGLGGRFTP